MKYFETIRKLPFIHGDSFDRLIIATAVEERLAIITDDNMIPRYPDIRVVF